MKISKQKFQQQLVALASDLRIKLEACTDFDALDEFGEFDEFDAVCADARASRQARAKHDFNYFRKIYFPHYLQIKTNSSLHSWLDATLPQLMQGEAQKLVIAAPRGEAKSTFVALFLVIWCIVHEKKQYILLIADALHQAVMLLEAIKVELESNPRLKADFGEFIGRIWNEQGIITVNNIKVQACGAEKKMRGLRHGANRPDLVILDDLENDENVQSPEQRDKLQAWLHKTVLNLGAAGGSLVIIYIGTILHYDSVLARTLQKPLWKKKIFKALEVWPDNLARWDEWEAVLLAQGEGAAQDFYEQHQAAMEAGAKVSWPEARSLYKLMLLRAENQAAFASELQNDPLATESAPFAHCLQYWSQKSEDWLIFGVCDPSLGKHGNRDPSAILVGGWDKVSLTLHVLEASIRMRHPDKIIEDIIDLHQEYQPLLWGVEAVQFQEFFAQVLTQRATARGLNLPVRPLHPSKDKQLRIEALQPFMVQGKIKLHPNQRTLIEQLLHFPKADHDDGPDALEMLWQISRTGFVSMHDAFMAVPKKRWSV